MSLSDSLSDFENQLQDGDDFLESLQSLKDDVQYYQDSDLWDYGSLTFEIFLICLNMEKEYKKLENTDYIVNANTKLNQDRDTLYKMRVELDTPPGFTGKINYERN